MFKRLHQNTHQLHEIDFVNPEIEQWEPILAGHFKIEYAEIRMLAFLQFVQKVFLTPTNMTNLKWIPTLSI